MTKYRVIVVVLLQLLNLSLVWTQCVPVKDCPTALKYIDKRRHDPETLRILRNANCFLSSGKYGVLCDKIPDFELSTAQDKTRFLPKSDECGIQAPGSKITRGKKTNFEDYPWLALLQYKNKTNHLAYRCHGSLISSRYVLTAAHCLSYSNPEQVGTVHKIMLGEYDITTKPDCIPTTQNIAGYCADNVQEISPESIHMHPNFLKSGAVSDIALIRLQKAATFSDFVKPICLPLEAIDLKPNDPMFVTGWGRTETARFSTVKLQARIFYLPMQDCALFDIDSTQICAGSTTGADSCTGDSGGPLIVNRLSKDRYPQSILVGVVSFGGRCGSGSAIYTNVTKFVKWILDTLHE